MNRLSDEIRIIPPVAWVIAALLEVGMFCLLFFVGFRGEIAAGRWSVGGAFAFSLWPGLLVAALALVIGYINADARRRGMRYVMWTLLAILIPNSIGIILYFILRDPLLVACEKCGAQARSGFAFCPQCGAALSAACPACKRPVDSDWQSCPYCGAGLKPAPPAQQMGTAHR